MRRAARLTAATLGVAVALPAASQLPSASGGALGPAPAVPAPPTAAAAAPPPEDCTTTTYDGFAAPLPVPLTRNSSADVVTLPGDEGTVLRVTPAQNDRSGSAFTSSRISLLDDGSFSTRFDFRFSGQAAVDEEGNPSGGDGLVFAIQNVDDQVGGTGGGIGYQGIERSLGVEFDSWANWQFPDPGELDPEDEGPEHVGIDVNGNVQSVVTAELPEGMVLDDPVVHHAWVDYDGATDILEVRLSDDDTRPATPLLSYVRDLPAVLGGAGDPADTAFIGFTSGTGDLVANHDVLAWTFSNCYRPVDTDSAPFLDAGGPYEVASGSPVAIAGAASDDLTSPLPVEWSADGPGACSFDDSSQVATTVTCDQPGQYTLSLRADDGVNPAESDSTRLEVTDVAEGRVAFTDEKDALHELAFDSDYEAIEDGWCPEPTDPGDNCGSSLLEPGETEHEGEASNSPIGVTFVSTAQSPEGDVYRTNGVGPPTRVTCDTDEDDPEPDVAIETHPVGRSVHLGPSELPDLFGDYTADVVAYAAREDGEADWDIFLSISPAIFHEIIIGRTAPAWGRRAPLAAAAAAPTACGEGWRTINVTDTEDVDELWPTWVDDGRLAYSFAAADELPDLGMTHLAWDVAERGGGQGDTLLEVGDFVQLTTTDNEAETQPAAVVVDPAGTPPAVGWIAFTTTEFRTDGSIGIIPAEPDADVDSLFGEDPPQSSEAAWSTGVNPTALAVTSTMEDPYGDIWVSEVDFAELPGPVGQPVNLTGPMESGGAENHPTWTDASLAGDDMRRIVFTRRAGGNYVDNPTRSVRALDGDISDVLLAGTDRRVLQAQSTADPEFPVRFDEAGPSYSPDGTEMVYSRATSLGSRTLMRADATPGAAPVPLMPASENIGAIDTDPVWSPDGRKVAFFRFGEGVTGLWIYDLSTRRATQATVEFDRHPTWSPDSRWVMVGRSESELDDFAEPEDGARRVWRTDAVVGDQATPELWVIDTEAAGFAEERLDTCFDGCEVDGRSPAWSPVGNEVVYVLEGELRSLRVNPDRAWEADQETTLLGMVESDGPDEPTEGRTVIETAEDPAWAPDGSGIAFAGQPVGQPDNRGIYRLDVAVVDGEVQVADLRSITDDRGPDTEPAYSPRNLADLRVTADVAGSPALVGQTVEVTFTITNAGPDLARGVAFGATYSAGALTAAVAPTPAGCQADGRRCDFALLAPGETRTYRVAVRHDSPVLGAATGTVESTTPDPDLGNNTASAPYEFLPKDADVGDLAVKVRVDEPVGYVGGFRTVTVVVRNRGPDPVVDAILRLEWPQAFLQRTFVGPLCLSPLVSCPLGTMNPGDRIEYQLPVALVAPGDRLPIIGTVSGATPDRDIRNNVSVARLDVLQPELHILPGVARPGQVVMAYGENMPPGTEIEIDWRTQSPGGFPLADPITIDPGPYLIAEDGTVRIPLPVIRRDFLGERILTATSTTAEFTDLEATLLVVLRSLSPPGFVERG